MICSFLAPQRNGTSILASCIAGHPEILGLHAIVENMSRLGGISVPEAIRLYSAVLQSIDLRNHKILLERNHLPLNEKFVGVLSNTDFKILVLLRDPREVILSFKEWTNWPGAKDAMREGGKNADQFIAGGVNKWIAVAQAYRQLRKTHDAMLLHHESICDNPHETAKRLFQWLGVSEEESYVNDFAARYKPASCRRKKDSGFQKYISGDLLKTAVQMGYDLT